MFETMSHPGKIAEGPGLISDIKEGLSHTGEQRLPLDSPLPVFGVGGVDEHNCHELIARGADGVAVISAVFASRDPEAAARRISLAMIGGGGVSGDA